MKKKTPHIQIDKFQKNNNEITDLIKSHQMKTRAMTSNSSLKLNII